MCYYHGPHRRGEAVPSRLPGHRLILPRSLLGCRLSRQPYRASGLIRFDCIAQHHLINAEQSAVAESGKESPQLISHQRQRRLGWMLGLPHTLFHAQVGSTLERNSGRSVVRVGGTCSACNRARMADRWIAATAKRASTIIAAYAVMME